MSTLNILGAGAVATHLARALKNAGHEICGVYSRTPESAEALAAQVGALATNWMQLLPDADVYIIAVSDNAVAEVANELAEIKQARRALVAHTAGSISINALPASLHGAAVLYPLQTFSKEVAVDFSAVPLFLETRDAALMPELRELAESLSHRVFELNEEGRAQLHLAAVFACNFANHCYALGEKLLADNGLPRDVIWPLVDETTRKLHALPAAQAQTGPAQRGDTVVMDRQVDALKNGHHPALADIYKLMSDSIRHNHD